MTLKYDLIANKEHWRAVAEIEREELRTTSIEKKWQQLNSIINIGIGLGIFTADPSEEVVYHRWAKLKESLE
jgi:hypothetical protein